MLLQALHLRPFLTNKVEAKRSYLRAMEDIVSFYFYFISVCFIMMQFFKSIVFVPIFRFPYFHLSVHDKKHDMRKS